MTRTTYFCSKLEELVVVLVLVLSQFLQPDLHTFNILMFLLFEGPRGIYYSGWAFIKLQIHHKLIRFF